MSEFPQDEVQYDNAVAAEDAYEAAVQRAARTQHALILAEAQTLTWKRRYVEVVKVAEGWERETLRLRERFGVGELGGDDDGEEGAGGGAAAVGEADSEDAVPL